MALILLILLLIFPLLGLFKALQNFRHPGGKFAIFCFYLLCAYILVPYSQGDIRLYEEKFNLVDNLNFFEFLTYLVFNVFSQEGAGIEIYMELNVFIVSRFTSNIAYCYCLTAAVFFFLWNNILSNLVKEYDLKNTLKKNYGAIILICFVGAYVVFIRAINGRFYLAYWILLASAYNILILRNRKYYWLLLSTVFVHQAFILLVILVFFVDFSKIMYKQKKSEFVLYGLIIVGTVFSQSGLSVLTDYLQSFGGDFENKYGAYTKNSYVTSEAERDRKWFQVIRAPLLFYTLFANLLVCRFKYVKKLTTEENKLYYLILVIFAINSFTINVPSFGDRYRNVLMGFIILLLAILYSRYQLQQRNFLFFLLVVSFVFYKFVTIKMLENYISNWLLYPLSLFLHNIYGPIPISE